MPCPQNDLGAALRSCHACPPAPPTRNIILADRVDASRCQPGMLVGVRLDGIPVTDSKGRFAHVRGIFFSARAHFVVTADSEAHSDSVAAYQIRALFGNLCLQDNAGWYYWQAIDGRDVLDDVWFRHWSQQTVGYLHYGTQGQLAPNITADNGLPSYATNQADVVVDASMHIPLVTYGGSPFEGLIPLGLLQRGGYQSLRFRVEPTLPAQGSPPTVPTGVAFDHFSRPDGSEGMDVWLDIVYLPSLVIDAPWQVDTYPLPEQQGLLHNPERTTEYAIIRYHSEDSAQSSEQVPLYGQALAQSYDGITLEVAGFSIMDGLQTQDAQTRAGLFYATASDGAWARDNAAQDLPMWSSGAFADPSACLQVVLLPMRQRATAPSGPVNFRYSIRTCAFTRYLHRTVDCHSTARAQKVARTLRCMPCQAIIPVDGNGRVIDTPRSTSPVLVVPNGAATMMPASQAGPY